MLVVKVELWPFGDDKKAKVIAEAGVANVGTNSRNHANYLAFTQTDRHGELVSKVTDHDRNSDVWALLEKVFKNLDTFHDYDLTEGEKQTIESMKEKVNSIKPQKSENQETLDFLSEYLSKYS